MKHLYKKTFISGLLLAATAIFTLNTATAQAPSNKEQLLGAIGFALTPPAAATDGTNANPYGQGVTVLNPENELYVRHGITTDTRLTMQRYDGETLSQESVIPVSAGANQPYSRSFTGNFFGTGKNEVVIDLLADATGSTIWLCAVQGADLSQSGYGEAFTIPNIKLAEVWPWQVYSVLSAAVGDFNGDGKDEIAVYNPVNECIDIYGMTGSDIHSLRLLKDGIDIPRRSNSTAKTNFWDYYAASLAAGDLNNDGKDDLAIVLNRHTNFRGVAANEHDATLTILYANSDDSFGFTPVTSSDFTDGTYSRLRYYEKQDWVWYVRSAGVAIGDITGDGLNEVVVMGLFSEGAYSNRFKVDGKFFREGITYFNGEGKLGRGTLNSTSKNYENAFYEYTGARVWNSNLINNYAPFALTTYKANGVGFAEHIWSGGVELKLSNQAFEVIDDGSTTVRMSGYGNVKVNRYFYDTDTDYANPSGDPYGAWFTETVAGNFDKSTNGKEGVAFSVGTYVTNRPRASVYIRNNAYDGSALPGAQRIAYHPYIHYARNISLAPIVANDRSARIKFREKSYFFSNPNIIAVLQAAPSFGELDYDRGTTSYSTTQGSGGSQSQMVTISAGIVFGFEHEFSFLGLGKTGLEMNTSLSASFGIGWETSKEYSFTETYDSDGDEDRVYLTMTPYTKYHYDMFVPETRMPTQQEYNDAKADYAALTNNFDPNAATAVENAQQIAKYAKLIEETDEQRAKGVAWGAIIPAGTREYTVSLPGSIVTTDITVDKYDAIAGNLGYETIRDNVFSPSYKWGEPTSYRNSIAGLDVFAIGNNSVESWVSVSNSGGSSTTRSIDITESNILNTTWGASLEFECILKAGGFKAGVTAGIDSETGFTSTTSTGTSFSGRVASMPTTATGYGFSWNFLAHRKKIEGAEVFVLEYLTTNVTQPIATTDLIPDVNGIIYVSETGAGNGEGSSWKNATKGLATPLYIAQTNPNIKEIWVTNGTYAPKYEAGNGTTGRDRAFVLVKNVKLYGGFNGSETSVLERSGEASVLDGNGAYHTVISAGDAGTALLDGFVITGGNADGTEKITVNGQAVPQGDGGGIYNVASSLAITNVIISGNNANWGGGLYNHGSSTATVTNALIVGNTASSDGGGVCNNESSPVFTNVTISKNAAYNGAGMANYNGAEAKINNSIIWGNAAGTQVYNNADSNPTYSYTLAEDENPLFVDAENGDFRLQKGSPCINAGNNDLYLSARRILNFDNEKDLAGNMRISGSVIDLGAYEYEYEYPDCTISGQVTVNGSPLAGVTITYDTDASVQTNTAGQYSITINYGKTVVLTPSLEGYTFTPESIECENVTGNLTGKDFVAVSTGSGIIEINNYPSLPKIAGYYNILGARLPQEPVSGIYIIMYDNGTAVKVMRK